MNETTGYSLSDIAALIGNKNGFGSGDGLGWLILILLFLGGVGGFGGNRGPAPTPMVPPNVATTDFVQQAVNSQTVNGQLQQIALSSADNNYQTAQLMNGQTNTLLQQGYTNQINAIQGFNSINQTLLGGFDNISQQLSQLGYQMDRCCCDVKTTLLQQQLDEANRKLADSKSQQSAMEAANYILSSQGRYVAWAGSGSQATT